MSSSLPTTILAAIQRERDQRAAFVFSPLCPFLPPEGVALNPRQAAQLVVAQAAGRARESELLRDAHGIQAYLGWTYAELCDEAQRIPKLLVAVSTLDGLRAVDPVHLVVTAQCRYGMDIPGKTREAQVARVMDPRYWRRALWKRIVQAKEHLHLKLSLVGKGARQYCSADALTVRRSQLTAQTAWLKNTMLRGEVKGEQVELPLEAVAKSPKQKLARLYAFIAAMDRHAAEQGLSVALLTTTLEGEWHANPLHPSPEHYWNGATPGQANQELGARFQCVRRDLRKKGVELSGLWAAEPHQDGCPHRHFWLIYDPARQCDVFAAFLKHFPGKLKLRRDAAAGGDVMYDTREDAQANIARPLKHKREGAQIDVSLIDRTKGSGASYVLKYVQKSIVTDATYADLLNPLGDAPASTKKTRKKKPNAADLRKQLHALQSIDAYRSVWRMRSCQFFGIRKCLTLWDELRRMPEPPAHPHLHAQWAAARGGDATGSIETGTQQGDAYTFLALHGGLAAAPKAAQQELGEDAPPPLARVYRTETLTQYGEVGSRIAGVELVQLGKGEARDVVLEAVPTRTARWELVPKKKENKANPPHGQHRGIVKHSYPSGQPHPNPASGV
jgi:hypothetical protein